MKRLVLAGGGHAHLHVLKSLVNRRCPDVEIVLISPYARQVYSGMLPGWMAGHYSLEQCIVPLGPLAEAAQVRFIRDSVVGLDADRRIVHTAHSGDIAYDLLSLDIGANIDESRLILTGAISLPIRPMEDFITGWSECLGRCLKNRQAKLVIVGGGAGGVELAFAAQHRFSQAIGAMKTRISLITGRGLLAGHGKSVIACVRRHLKASAISLVEGYATGSANGLILDGGTELPADYVISATGAAPAPWLAKSGLKLAPDGFVAVGKGQQSLSHENIFAAGDIASRIDTPHPKSGVYAVRAGPVLVRNIERALSGQVPVPYQPQKRSLYLLATGPKHAIMSWNGFCASGDWIWRWKDWIDRRFMRQYHSGNGTGEEVS